MKCSLFIYQRRENVYRYTAGIGKELFTDSIDAHLLWFRDNASSHDGSATILIYNFNFLRRKFLKSITFVQYVVRSSYDLQDNKKIAI